MPERKYTVEVKEYGSTGLFQATLRNTETGWSEAHMGISEASAHRIGKNMVKRARSWEATDDR